MRILIQKNVKSAKKKAVLVNLFCKIQQVSEYWMPWCQNEKKLKMNKKGWKGLKKCFNQLLDALSTRKLVETHNTPNTAINWIPTVIIPISKWRQSPDRSDHSNTIVTITISKWSSEYRFLFSQVFRSYLSIGPLNNHTTVDDFHPEKSGIQIPMLFSVCVYLVVLGKIWIGDPCKNHLTIGRGRPPGMKKWCTDIYKKQTTNI